MGHFQQHFRHDAVGRFFQPVRDGDAGRAPGHPCGNHGLHEGLHGSLLISAMVAFSLFNLPIATVAIIDKTYGTPPKVVANIPVFLAATAALVTQGSDFFTRSFEASYAALFDVTHIATKAQLDSLTFRDHDLGFGHRLIRDSRKMRIADPILYADMVYFTRDCINTGMAEGKLDFKRIYQGNTPADTWSYIVANVNPARMTTYHDQQQNLKIGYCDEVANGTLQVDPLDGLTYRLDQGIEAAKKYYGQKYSRNDVTGALYAKHLPNGYSVMLGASMNASEIMKQNMFLNLYNDSKGAIAQMMGDPAAVTAAYAKAQATATANSSYMTMASLSESTMPRIRNLMEFIIYSIYPFLVLFIIANAQNSIPIMKTYIMTLVWINLWPPLYAILNFSMHMWTAKTLIRDVALSGGLSIQTMGMISGDVISDQALMGYMVILIPGIALGITKGGEVAMNSIAQTWMAPTQAASQGASGAATGNMSQGNLNMDNANANKIDMSGSWAEPASYQSQLQAGGWSHRFTGDGSHVMDGSKTVSDFGSFSLHTSKRLAGSEQMQSERAESATVARMQSYAETTAAALQQQASFEQGHGKGERSGVHDGVGQGSSKGREATDAMKDVAQFAKDHSLTQKQAATLMLQAAASAKVGFGTKDSRGSVGTSAQLDGKSSAEATQLLKAAQQFSVEQGFSAKVDAATKAAHETTFDTSDESSRRASESVRDSYDRGQQALTQASSSYQESLSHKETAARLREGSESMDTNSNKLFRSWLEDQEDTYGNPGKKLGGSGAISVLTHPSLEGRREWYAERFLDEEGPRLLEHAYKQGAEIKAPGKAEDVRDFHEAGDALQKGADDVEAQGAAWKKEPQAKAAKAGINPGAFVTSNVPKEAAAMQAQNTNAVNGGRSKVVETGAPLKAEVDGRTQPGSQHLAGLAVTNALAQVTPDEASRYLLEKIPGINTSVGTPGAAVAEASAARAKAAAAADNNKQISPDTTPNRYGGNNNLLNDKNYDPAQVARNPLGFFNQDQVKQAQEEMKSPQHQKQNVQKDAVRNDTPKTLNPDQVRQADQQYQARQMEKELKLLHQHQNAPRERSTNQQYQARQDQARLVEEELKLLHQKEK